MPHLFFSFFFLYSDNFTPYAYAPPSDTFESGVLFHIWWAVETFACFTRQSAMESSVVSSLPDYTFTPTPRKHGVERSTMKHSSEPHGIAPHVSHIVDCSPSALLPSGELYTDGMRCLPWTNLFVRCRPA